MFLQPTYDTQKVLYLIKHILLFIVLWFLNFAQILMKINGLQPFQMECMLLLWSNNSLMCWFVFKYEVCHFFQ